MNEDNVIPVLREIRSILEMGGIRCWLDYGTLLGAVRHGRCFSDDGDIDFSLLHRDADRFLRQIPVFQQKGFATWLHFNNITLLKHGVPVMFACYQPKSDLYFHLDYPYNTFFERTLASWKCRWRNGLQTVHDVATYRELQTIPCNRVAKVAYRITMSAPCRWLIRQTAMKFWGLLGGEYFGYAVPRHFFDELDKVVLYEMEFNSPSSVQDYLRYKYGEEWLVDKKSSEWDIWNDGAIIAKGTREDSKITRKRFWPWKTLADVLADMQHRKTVYVPMCADFLHYMHVWVIREATKYGRVIVGLMTDKSMMGYKRKPFMTYEQRKFLIEHVMGVSEVVPQTHLDYVENLRKYKPDYVLHGVDWRSGPQKEARSRVMETVKEWGGQVIETPYIEGIGSTRKIKEIAKIVGW